MRNMKATVDIPDERLALAKRHSMKSGRSMKAVIEQVHRRVLGTPASPRRYRLSDLSVGNPENADPLETCSWQDVRAMIYGDPRTR